MLSFKPTHPKLEQGGLRNANDLLNRIRSKYVRVSQHDNPNHNKTFIEESLELDENQEGPDKTKAEPHQISV